MSGTGRAMAAMPMLLKGLSWAGPVLLLLGIVPLVDDRMLVFGRPMPHGWWWSSGAVTLALVPDIVLCVAGLLTVRRGGFARVAHVLGWLLMTVSVPAMAYVAGFDPAGSSPTVIVNGACTVLIAVYLYASPHVRRYFGTASP